VGEFPNRETQVGQPRGPKPGSRPGKPRIGKRRRQKILITAERAAVEAEVLPKFEGDSLTLLQQVYRDPGLPIDLRLMAARIAAPYENAPLAPTEKPRGSTLEALVLGAIEREQHIDNLNRTLSPVLEVGAGSGK
jgi:hypothetical protein